MLNLPQTPLKNQPLLTNASSLWSLALLRAIGYGFLIFFLFDFADTLIPLRLTNPSWEFQTFGALVEKVPILFLALVMIYLGRDFGRKRAEKILLSIITWLVLLLSLTYFLLIPLGIINTNRLLNQNNQQTLQLNQQVSKIQKAQTNLKTSNTQSELQQILSRDLGTTTNLPELQNPQQIKALKNQLTTAIDNNQNQLQAQTRILKDARLELLKKSVKWNLGSLISAILLLYIWRAAKSK